MNEITYWLYYLKGETNNELYAYTDNKKYAKLFELDRNMNMFIRVKRKITREEVNFLAREYQHYYLREAEIRIFDKVNEKWINGMLIMTITEYMTVMSSEIRFLESDIYSHCWLNPAVFKKSIFKALEVLEYNNVYRQISPCDDEYDNIDTTIKIKPDVLGIFLYYYGKTMRMR